VSSPAGGGTRPAGQNPAGRPTNRTPYPIPLFRFERGYDIVPHFPFSPLFYKWISKAQIDHVISNIFQIFKFLGADIDPEGVLHEKVEYVHAGHLLYHENDEATA
jgi:hypothetical protein